MKSHVESNGEHNFAMLKQFLKGLKSHEWSVRLSVGRCQEWKKLRSATESCGRLVFNCEGVWRP